MACLLRQRLKAPILSPLSTCLAESRRGLPSSPDLSRLSTRAWIFWLMLGVERITAIQYMRWHRED